MRKVNLIAFGLSAVPLLTMFGTNETWNEITYAGQTKGEETEGILTVESNGDVLANGNLTLRSTKKIVFKTNFRAYTNSTMRAGIDSDLDGFTESDVDEDGIPDHYEREFSDLNEFKAGDVLQINTTHGLTYYDVFHLNLDHKNISSGSKNFRAPYMNALLEDFEFDDNGIIDTTIIEVFGHYDGDGIKDYWFEIEQYDPTWNLPLYTSGYTGFNIFTPFDYRVFDGYGGAITGLLFGTGWGYASASWSPWVVDSIRYDIVRYGEPSTLFEGGSYKGNPDSDYTYFPILPEITNKTGTNITYKFEILDTEPDIYYELEYWCNGQWVVLGAGVLGNGSDQVLTRTLSIAPCLNLAIARIKEGPIAELVVYRPLNRGNTYGYPYPKTRVPDNEEVDPGAYIRKNGDDFFSSGKNPPTMAEEITSNDEDDLVELEIKINYASYSTKFDLYLERDNSNLLIWSTSVETGSILTSGTRKKITPSSDISYWVENPNGGSGKIKLIRKNKSTGTEVVLDEVQFHQHKSIILVYSGEFQDDLDYTPNETWPALNRGTMYIAKYLYENGYDAYMLEEPDGPLDGDIKWEDEGYYEIVAAVEHRGVTEVATVGYSRGANSTYNILLRINNHKPNIKNKIVATAYVDAISENVIPDAFRIRPPNSVVHANYYQSKQDFLSGWNDWLKADSMTTIIGDDSKYSFDYDKDTNLTDHVLVEDLTKTIDDIQLFIQDKLGQR